MTKLTSKHFNPSCQPDRQAYAVLRHAVLHHGAVRHGALRHGALRHGVVPCDTVHHGAGRGARGPWLGEL